jgi:FkbM family methyltransferase
MVRAAMLDGDGTDRLAILVPYRDRARYLEVFARAVPEYLERVNGLRDYAIYVAEQESPDTFNLALSRNVAACAALADGGFGTFVFHDVDIIPVAGIDYAPRPFNVGWFLSAGSCKVHVPDFVRANGYNPAFVGWGDEDVEFYHRLETAGAPIREWHRMPESQAAVAINLDWAEMSDDASLRESQRYFGHHDAGPRFVTWNSAAHGRALAPYDKSIGFLTEERRVRNQALWGQVRNLPLDSKRAYMMANGLNRVNLAAARRERRGAIRWLRYRTEEALAPPPAEPLCPAPATAERAPLPLPVLAQRLTERQPGVFFVQIGAMDGVRFDPLFPLVTRHGWRGLLVEPLPDLFAELQRTYRDRDGLAFENAAIADSDGERVMFRIPPGRIEENGLPDWAAGLGSLYADRNALAWPQLAPHVIQQPVRCLTLPALLAKHRVERIDVLQIDTEGADFAVLMQLDWRRFRPAIIQLEICNLAADEKTRCRALLTGHGYRIAEGNNDMLAVHETLAASPAPP